jgi:hypothetical protein
MTKERRKQLAAKQRKVASESRQFLKRWIMGSGVFANREETYRSFVESDVKPLLEIARLFVAGKYAEAYGVAWNMDTSPRENIIDEIYEVIAAAVRNPSIK